MRKLHFKPSKERDTLPALESFIAICVGLGIWFLIWLTENLI